MNKAAMILAGMAACAATAIAGAQAADQSGSRAVSARAILEPNDLNKDGIVTREEAAKVNGGLYLTWPAYDLDKDGKLDEAEVYRATREMMVGTAQRRITGDTGGRRALVKPEAVIAANDQDKDGIVTREEAARADLPLNKLWDWYDLDKDGKVDLAEVRRAQPF